MVLCGSDHATTMRRGYANCLLQPLTNYTIRTALATARLAFNRTAFIIFCVTK